jgi:RluA family pseudouridine synthase
MVLAARHILFEDDDLLAVDKPAGLVSHGTVDPARDHLVAALTRLLVERDGEAGHLTLLHRLDRDTSGVVLLSRRPEHDGPLGEAFAQRRVAKTYLAIVEVSPGLEFPTCVLDAYLAPGKGPGGRTAVVRAGGRPAVTHVRPLQRHGDLCLVEARPLTGRAHQIRVHLAHAGFPIVGDALYGGRTADVRRLLLHARQVELAHPRTAQRLTIAAPPPRAFSSRFPSLRAGQRPTDSEPSGA